MATCRVVFTRVLAYVWSVRVRPFTFTKASRHIPQSVKNQEWQNDQGIYREYGGNQHLQYDYVIPYSKGGASTVGNLQLLCQICNDKKGDRI